MEELLVVTCFPSDAPGFPVGNPYITELDPDIDAGSLAFSEGATVMGYNPCVETVEAADAAISPASLNLAAGGK